MNESLFSLISQLSPLNPQARWAWALPLMLLLAGAGLLLPAWRRRRHERRVQQTLQRMGKYNLSEVTLDNGMDGFVYIDHLALTGDTLLVVSLMRTRGAIFGGEKIDNWARVIGRRTYKFPNPLAVSMEKVLAVKYHLPGIPVRGVVLFDEGCSFPKGKPAGVMLSRDIDSDRRRWEVTEIPPALQSAWEKLEQSARQGAAQFNRDLALLREDRSHRRELWGLSLLLAALGWGLWRLLLA